MKYGFDGTQGAGVGVILGLFLVCGVGCDGGGVEEGQYQEKTEVEKQNEEGGAHYPAFNTYGELRNVNMHQEYSAVVPLREALEEQSITAGVGALGDLMGEITVVDGTVYLGRAVEGEEPVFEVMKVSKLDEELEATMLFGASVEQWQEVDGVEGLDLKGLEDYLDGLSEKRDQSRFVYRITDPEGSAKWHVVDGELLSEIEAGSCGERHEQTHQFESDAEEITLIGLYAPDYTGIIVDHRTSLHTHIIDADGRTGHLHALQLSDRAEIEIGR